MPLLLRQDKGTALTNTELDNNFIFLNGRIDGAVNDIETIVDVTIPALESDILTRLDGKQDVNTRLTSLSGLASLGLITHINQTTGAIVSRSIEAGSSNIVVTNGSGVAGNPTVNIGENVLTNSSTHVLSNKTISGNNNTLESIPASSIVGVLGVNRGGTGGATEAEARISLGALRAPISSGIVVQLASDQVVTRQLAVTGTGLSISSESGTTGNPTIAINATNLATANAIVARDSSGNFSAGIITANLNGNATNASTVTNGVYTTGSYNNPSWITGLSGSKVTNIPNSSLINSSVTVNGVSVSLGQGITLTPANLGGTPNNTPSTLVQRDSSGNFSAGTITASLNGTALNATSVTNGVYTTGSYNNPSWITGLAGSKVTNIPNSSLQNSFINLNGTPIALGQSATFPFVVTNGSYSNPSWITSLAGSKVTEIPNSSLVNPSFTINGVLISLGGSASINPIQLGGVTSNTPNTLVLRDSSGDFSAGTITGSLNGNALTASTATTALAAIRLANARTINGVAFDGTQNITVSDPSKVPLSGAAMGGFLTLNAAPIENLHAATKQYVDQSVASSLGSGSVKAWVTFNGVNGGILGAYNVTSVSVIGEGKYQINIVGGTFSNGNFAAAGMASDVDHLVTFNNSSQTSLQVYTSDAHADSNNQTSRTTGRVMVLMAGT